MGMMSAVALVGMGDCVVQAIQQVFETTVPAGYPFVNPSRLVAILSGVTLVVSSTVGWLVFGIGVIIHLEEDSDTSAAAPSRYLGFALFLVPLVVISLTAWGRVVAFDRGTLPLFSTGSGDGTVVLPPLSIRGIAYLRIQPLSVSTVSLFLCSLLSLLHIAIGGFPGGLLTPSLGLFCFCFVLLWSRTSLTKYRRSDALPSFGVFTAYYWSTILLLLVIPWNHHRQEAAEGGQEGTGTVKTLLSVAVVLLLPVLPGMLVWSVSVRLALRRPPLEAELAAATRELELLTHGGLGVKAVTVPTTSSTADSATTESMYRTSQTGYCGACKAAPATHILVPCGHVGVCPSCKPDQCPSCDRPVEMWVPMTTMVKAE
jgi:hypothetical protein